ncbi:uncharacterized protein LOC126554558 [Aphis gossypii]|uniref:uncharacterized protein LOC126554558 n=1 Tax=Aphis gossypii TaxID=80765 RepID=UPI002158B593|nr:uncharacterized protein LOC126554558 [Aphis gossypii]
MGSSNEASNDLYNNDGDNRTIIMDELENTDLTDTIQDLYTTTTNGKRISTANSTSAAKAKKARMNLVQSPGFVEISSSANRKIMWYYSKNTDNVQNYNTFLQSLKISLVQLLKTRVQNDNSIKFNLKLESTYNRPNVENSSENRAFKTSAKEIYTDTKIERIVEESFMKLLSEEDAYVSRGSGFTLQSIDGLLIAIYKYTPMSGSSYIQLPKSIMNKRAIINPQNIDQQCLKWAILARHVAGDKKNKNRVNENYTKHEDKYIFDGISFPTPLSDISKFEKNNPDVSVNVYGLEKKIQQPLKHPVHCIFPLKVADT